MDHLQFSTRLEAPSDRCAYWEDVNQAFFGNLKVRGLDEGPVDAQLDAYEVGMLRMLHIAAPAHQVRRTKDCGPLPTDDLYKLVLQLAGRAEIRHQDRAFALQPGHWSLYDPRLPYAITNFERADLLVVQIPRQLLKGFKVPNLHTSEVQGASGIGLYAVVGSFLRSLAEQLQTLPNGVGQPLSETVVGLLASTLGAHQDTGADYATLPSVLKARVKQYVQTHLAESDLSIDRIARDLRCSKRYLHRVFEDETLTLDRHIWLARLERCHAALVAPGAAQRPISEIAFAWGFGSSAHFSRMFRKHFGLSPVELRRQVAAVQPVPLPH